MSLLKISTEQVNILTSRFDICNSNMNHSIESVQNNINKLGWAWRGKASDNAIAAFGTIKNSINVNRFNVMSSYSNYLKGTIVPGYEHTEEITTNLGQSYKAF